MIPLHTKLFDHLLGLLRLLGCDVETDVKGKPVPWHVGPGDHGVSSGEAKC